jgi:hypothetical protein
MIRIIHNLRIGTKLAITAAGSALLVGAIILAQMAGYAATRKANAIVADEQAVTRDAIDAKASIRGMQTGVRDVRLASTTADLQKANTYLASRLRSVNKFVDEMLKHSRSEENRVRLEKLNRLAYDYAREAQRIVAVRNDIVEARNKRPDAGPDAARTAALDDETARIARR